VSGNSVAHQELFKQAVESMKRNKVGLKGALSFGACLAGLTDLIAGIRHPFHAIGDDGP
jgi:hypothetical protein